MNIQRLRPSTVLRSRTRRSSATRWTTSAFTACSLMVLAGCVTPTPYQPLTAEEDYGYQDREIETSRFRVSFSGNSKTARETVEDYLLFRAAELTLDKGHDYFVMVDKDTERFTRYFVTGAAPFGGFSGFGGFSRFHGFHPFVGTGFATGTARPVHRYEAFATILTFSGEKPPRDPNVYDARDVIDHLRPSIVRKDKPAS